VNESASALRFLDAPSDLISGVYEGGLKTWECSLDLVRFLHARQDEHATQQPIRSVKRALEVNSSSHSRTVGGGSSTYSLLI
jgi:hypothetical protein